MKKILVTGAGGFIGGHLVRRLLDYPDVEVRAVDKKPLTEWYQRDALAENWVMDLSYESNCDCACRGMDEVFQLAADMGGMGFIERFRIECMRSVLINVHMLSAAHRAGVKKYFFSSSACVYNTDLQKDVNCAALKESDAYPAMAERGYGWEKLYSEMLCQEYWAERGMPTYIARFHNVYGPHGTWDGGREKAPAALCRKVAQAVEAKREADSVLTGVMGKDPQFVPYVPVWGNGEQRRSYMYIDDCTYGILRLVQEPDLVATPINIGSSECVSVNEMLDIIEGIAGVKVDRVYDLSAPKGVGGRNSDNTFIKEKLLWEPNTPLAKGLYTTYHWIKQQIEYRKQGMRVIL